MGPDGVISDAQGRRKLVRGAGCTADERHDATPSGRKESLIHLCSHAGIFDDLDKIGKIVVNYLVARNESATVRGQYFDVAIRDLGLAVGAFSLGRLSEYFSDR